MRIISDLKIKNESKRLASLHPVSMGKQWEDEYASLNASHVKLRNEMHNLRIKKCNFELGLGECSCAEHPDIKSLGLRVEESANKINGMWHEKNLKEKEAFLHYSNLIHSARLAKIKYLKSNP